jgi:thiamine transporter ThiT
MQTRIAPAVVGSALVTALVAWHTHLPFSGPHAKPGAALLTLALLFSFAYPFFALSLSAIFRTAGNRSALLRWSMVLLAALVLAVLLRFYQFLPAFLLFGWCKVGLACGEAGNTVFNSLLSAGKGVVVLLLLPLITFTVLLVSYWLHLRHTSSEVRSAA